MKRLSEVTMAAAMTAERIAGVAAAWNFARVRAIELATERGGIDCEKETAFMAASAAWEEQWGHTETWEFGPRHDELKNVPDPPESPGDPCFKVYLDPTEPDGDRERLPLDRWCSSCQRRQKVHLAMREANRRRGALLRVLMRYAAQWPVDMRMTRELKPEAYQRAMGARTL